MLSSSAEGNGDERTVNVLLFIADHDQITEPWPFSGCGGCGDRVRCPGLRCEEYGKGDYVWWKALKWLAESGYDVPCAERGATPKEELIQP